MLTHRCGALCAVAGAQIRQAHAAHGGARRGSGFATHRAGSGRRLHEALTWRQRMLRWIFVARLTG